MESIQRTCHLRCILGSHAPIKLNHNIETVIGRSKITGIKDQACSRQQLSMIADCNECIVKIKQLGVNPSGLSGFALSKKGVYQVEHGSKVEILLNNYAHVIEFDPPPENFEKKNKRKSEESGVSPVGSKSPKVLESCTTMNVKEIEVTEHGYWENIDSGKLYVFTSKDILSNSKIAAFDLDGTLIKTKSRKVHPVDTNDWEVAFPVIPKVLREHFHRGYKIVILSNQAPIGTGRVKIEHFKLKIQAIAEKLNVPLQVYLATGKGLYRKPLTGMWKVLSEYKNDDVEIDKNQSFFCGDAAGRLANWAPGKKKDHSMADRLFAENLKLKFLTPEQLFLGSSVTNIPVAKPEFNPKDMKECSFNNSLISRDQEILVLVGYPGSGKSFLAKEIERYSFNKYATVCRDILGTWQKCASEAKRLIHFGKSVIVDSTNPDKESRARWVTLSLELKVDCRCAKMAVTMAHAKHNNKFRELMKIQHQTVNDIVFNTYKNKYVAPEFSEGFREIINVHFSPHFLDKDAEKLYFMHLLEK